MNGLFVLNLYFLLFYINIIKHFSILYLFQFGTMSAASAAHGEEDTLRPLMAMCTSSLVCVNTTWPLTAMKPTGSFLCT